VRTAPRGATAPEATKRRRRDEERDGSGTVIAPGHSEEEVPEFDQPPDVGVIGYGGDEAA